jgi:hypothetical protein
MPKYTESSKESDELELLTLATSNRVVSLEDRVKLLAGVINDCYGYSVDRYLELNRELPTIRRVSNGAHFISFLSVTISCVAVVVAIAAAL